MAHIENGTEAPGHGQVTGEQPPLYPRRRRDTERMGVIRRTDAPVHTGKQGYLDRQVASTGGGPGSHSDRAGHLRRDPQPERFSAVHGEGNEHGPAPCAAHGCLSHS